MDIYSEIYVERLNQLVRVLREVRDENRFFNLNVWARKNCNTTVETDLPEGVCKTVACAIGWAAQDPWFRRRGFCLVNKNSLGDWYPRFKFRGETKTSWSAINAFFDTTTYTSDKLFSGREYPSDYTIETVIDRVETYIKNRYGEEALKRGVTT